MSCIYEQLYAREASYVAGNSVQAEGVGFFARLRMAEAVKRFAVSGAGRCFGMTDSEVHSDMMMALARRGAHLRPLSEAHALNAEGGTENS